jgi:cobalt/nickel transport system permease protein
MTSIAKTPPIWDSPLAQLDPRARLISFFIAVLAIAALRSLLIATVALACAALLLIAARLPLLMVLRRLGIVALALAPVLILLPLVQGAEGLELAGLLFVKAAAITALALALIGTAPLLSMAWAARKLGAPTTLVRIALLSRRFSFVLADEMARMRTAMRVRGFRAGWDRRTTGAVGGLFGTLLVRGAARAERVAHAQHCRGDDGVFRMLDPPRFQLRDGAFVVAAIVLSAIVLIGDFLIVH